MFNFGPGEMVFLILVVPFLFALYFLPVVIAIARRHPNTLGIVLLDLFLGWTLLGWIGALVWSLVRTTSAPAAAPEAQPAGTAGGTPIPGAARFCTRCGAALPPGAAFCPACGAENRV